MLTTINLLLGVATMVVVPGELSVNRTEYLGKLEEFLWDMRAKWDALGIQLGISMGTCEVQCTTLPPRVMVYLCNTYTRVVQRVHAIQLFYK